MAESNKEQCTTSTVLEDSWKSPRDIPNWVYGSLRVPVITQRLRTSGTMVVCRKTRGCLVNIFWSFAMVPMKSVGQQFPVKWDQVWLPAVTKWEREIVIYGVKDTEYEVLRCIIKYFYIIFFVLDL